MSELKVLQWNVFYKEDPDWIAAEIKRINPDVVCGQELMQRLTVEPQNDTARQIAEKIKYHYVYQVADTWTGRVDKENQGNAIFSKYPFVRTSFAHLQPPKNNPPDPEHEGRVYLEVEVNINGKLLTIGTAHLSYSNKFAVTDHRKKEVDNLLDILKEKQSNYVFTGDLNSLPDSYTIAEIQKLQGFQSPGPRFNEKTWTTKPFNYGGFQEDKLNWRLDYVFVSSDVKVISSQIIETSVSDHLPILLTIDV